jgi:hypothetical protein
MLTQREARQRLAVNRMRLSYGSPGEYRVNFLERDVEATAYYTDDLLDAVMTGAAMRRRMHDQISRKYLAHVA